MSRYNPNFLMPEMLDKIRVSALALPVADDYDMLDYALSELEYLVYCARQRICDEWSAPKKASPKLTVLDIDLSELGL